MILALDRLWCAIHATLRPFPSWREAYARAMAGRVFPPLDAGAAGASAHPRAVAELARREYDRGNLAAAEAFAARALERDPSQPLALLTRGRVLASRGDFAGAADALARGARGSKDAMAWTQLGAVYRELGNLDEACRALEQAIAIDQGFATAHLTLGELHLASRRVDLARAAFVRAVRYAPGSSRARTRLATVEAMRGDLEAAERLLAEARDIDPGDADALVQQGDLRRDDGRADEALECYRRARAIDPLATEAHVGSAFVHLQRGDYETAWDEFEWRLRRPSVERMLSSPTPVWRGQPLDGRSVCVQFEPGLAETILFARFLPALAARGARVVVETAPPLQRLLTRMPGMEVVAAGSDDASRARGSADYRVPLLSLPHRLGARRNDIESAPYLRADETRAAEWRRRLQAVPGTAKVGVTWWGHPAVRPDFFRSVSPQAGPDTTFVALEPPPPGTAPEVVDWTGELSDFADAADLIDALDLVVGPPNPFTHLAGALGRPGSVLLKGRTDWRWGPNGEATPWYPSLRLAVRG